MDIRQCKRCTKIFQYRGNPVCPNCVVELDDLFNSVKNYLYNHPNATMDEICEETGVEEEYLVAWLREGRLIVSGTAHAMIKCDLCGAPIRTGRFCNACAYKLGNKIESSARSLMQDKDSDQTRGMYTRQDKR